MFSLLFGNKIGTTEVEERILVWTFSTTYREQKLRQRGRAWPQIKFLSTSIVAAWLRGCKLLISVKILTNILFAATTLKLWNRHSLITTTINQRKYLKFEQSKNWFFTFLFFLQCASLTASYFFILCFIF